MTTSHDYQYSNRSIYGIRSDAVRHTWAGYLLFVLASSLIGDTIILIASIKYKAFRLHRVIVVTIQHIAFCDLMVSVFTVLPHFISVTRNEWVLGDFLCNVTPYTRYYFYVPSALLICNMTCSKLLLLKYPLRFGTTSTKKAHMICAGCWAAALVLPVTMIILAAAEGEFIDFSYLSYNCDYYFTPDLWTWLRPTLAVLFLFFPNCVVVIATTHLLVIAKNIAHRGRESLNWQGIMSTILIASVYCICFLPSIVYHAGEAIFETDGHTSGSFHNTISRISASFIYINTMSNFYIYSLSVQSFRDYISSRMHLANRIFSSIGTFATPGKALSFCHSI